MEEKRLSPTYRLHARSSKTLLCGVELTKYKFYAYLISDLENECINCCLFLGEEAVIIQNKFSTTMCSSQNLLDDLVRLARYTITTPTTNEKYLEWRDTTDSKEIDKILDRYEQDYGDAIISLFGALYIPIGNA